MPDAGSRIALTTHRGARCVALQLDHLHPGGGDVHSGLAQDILALITALEGHRGVRFVLQTHVRPQPAAPERGEVDVHLLGVADADGDDRDHGGDDRLRDLADDLLDLLGTPPLRWSFSAVTAGADLGRVLAPVEHRHVAEIARREEPCLPTEWSRAVGFTSEPSTLALERQLWSMWTLGAASADLRRVIAVLLAQEHPVCLRVVLEPTELTPGERNDLERLAMDLAPVLPPHTLLRASLSTLESLLYLRPVFHMTYLVASAAPLSRSLLSALGHASSEPGHHGGPQPLLQGGFAVIRGDDDPTLVEAFGSLTHPEPGTGLAPAALARARRLFGAREAANVFRLPAAGPEGLPGLETLDVPSLPPPLSRLPGAGIRIGGLIGHGGLAVLQERQSRFRHTYICGQTGTGKSTLLLNLALQDIRAGEGVAVLDPHGDLVEALLAAIPPARAADVVLVDPADPVAVVGVNLLEAESPVQRDYLVEELCAMFYALFDPERKGIVGPRFETMMRQAANLLMSHDTPASMLDIVTVFTDGAVRAHLTKGITDPVLAEFWLGEMAMSRSNEWQEVISWFRSKFEIFRTSRLVRNIIGQSRSTISFGRVLAERKILLVNLAKGLLGTYNSALVGHIVFARLWSAALERASMPIDARCPFHIYIDEFQNLTNDSLPTVLSEARKFRISLTLANQYFSQVAEPTRDALMGNVGTKIAFRIGPKDAALFSPWLGSGAHPSQLPVLPNFVAVAALSDDGVPLPPFPLRTDPFRAPDSAAGADHLRRLSRRSWGAPVDTLDAEFFGRWASVEGSISHRIAHRDAEKAPRRPKPQSSFLEEWLAKREAAAQPPPRALDGDADALLPDLEDDDDE